MVITEGAGEEEEDRGTIITITATTLAVPIQVLTGGIIIIVTTTVLIVKQVFGIQTTCANNHQELIIRPIKERGEEKATAAQMMEIVQMTTIKAIKIQGEGKIKNRSQYWGTQHRMPLSEALSLKA